MASNLLKIKLRQLRSDKKISLDKLSEETNISKSYLWELENRDNVSPSAEKLSKIADALGVTLDFLLDHGSEQPDQGVIREAFFRKFDRLDDDAKKRVEDIIDTWGKKD